MAKLVLALALEVDEDGLRRLGLARTKELLFENEPLKPGLDHVSTCCNNERQRVRVGMG